MQWAEVRFISILSNTSPQSDLTENLNESDKALTAGWCRLILHFQLPPVSVACSTHSHSLAVATWRFRDTFRRQHPMPACEPQRQLSGRHQWKHWAPRASWVSIHYHWNPSMAGSYNEVWDNYTIVPYQSYAIGTQNLFFRGITLIEMV